MVFLASLTIISWLTGALFLEAITKRSKNDHSQAIWTVIFFGLPTMVLFTPFLIEMLQISRFMRGEGVSMGYDYVPMSMIGAGGVALLAAFGIRLYRQWKQPAVGFFSLGATVTGLIISAYFAFVALDQFMFYVPHRKEAGVLNWDYFKKQVQDIKCDSEMLLKGGIDSNGTKYRCPVPSQFILGRFSGLPFVAWPGYTEGHSVRLTAAIHRLYDESIKADK